MSFWENVGSTLLREGSGNADHGRKMTKEECKKFLKKAKNGGVELKTKSCWYDGCDAHASFFLGLPDGAYVVDVKRSLIWDLGNGRHLAVKDDDAVCLELKTRRIR